MLAHDFSLADQNGTFHTLSEYRGKWVVLFFYPKDDTPGCTIEACSFRDNIEKLKERNVIVLGVSKDTVASHKKFAEKYHLNFPLLSDPDLTVIKSYGTWGKKLSFGKYIDGILRKTYLIDLEGNVKKIYPKVTPKEHVAEILQDLTTFQK